MEEMINAWPIAVVIIAVVIVFARLLMSEEIDEEEVDDFLNSIKEDEYEERQKSKD